MIIASLLFAYLLGSIPFGLIVTRLAGLGDIRAVGSGNIGATNVMRTGHKGLAIATLALDASKGIAAVIFAGQYFGHNTVHAAALFAVLGHVFPVWLGFKGGKGVATTLGVIFALNWLLGLAVCALWLLAFLFTRFSSVASMMAIGWSAAAAYVLADEITAMLCLALAALIIFTHRENIARLLSGAEQGFSKIHT